MYEITFPAMTSAQRTEGIELVQKIEAINAAINEIQILRRDAQAAYLAKWVDDFTPKEQALAEERNKLIAELRALRSVQIREA
jgi:predicted chitinase